MQKKGTILGATMLVAGTCIGAGMLALPVATGEAGFFPSFLFLMLGWAFMTTTALFLVEVNLWMEEGAHIVTMTSRLLGPIGKAVAWGLYLFICYASLVAYTAGCGDLFQAAFHSIGIDMSALWSALIFIVIFGSILYMGNVFLGRINTLLMVGLIGSYILLIIAGVSHVRWHYLLRQEWGSITIAVPLLLTVFSFQTIIPSLTLYLKQDGRALRLSIIMGTGLALIFYLIWQWLVLGTVLNDGDHGLAAALALGKPATEFIGVATEHSWFGTIADFFAFFALVTSFLGMALGLFDFLADGLKIPRNRRWGNLLLGVLVAAPTLFFALTFERIFLKALDATGGIGDAILNGLIPALMLWIGRYNRHMHSSFRTPGGKPLILAVIVYALFVFTVEVLGKFGVITSLGG